MSKGTMLYIRVMPGVMEDLFKAGVRKDFLQNKSALSIICENLLEWAASYAANGSEAEKILEMRERQGTYQRTCRERKMGKGADLERMQADAAEAKKIVEKKLSLAEAEQRLRDYFNRKKEEEQNGRT